jgi:hypothetical protein
VWYIWALSKLCCGNLELFKRNQFLCAVQWTYKLRRHIRTCIAEKECTFKLLAKNSFLLTFGCDTVLLSFEAILIHLPSGLIFAQSVLRKMRFSSLAYGIVCINKRLTYITNDVLTSKQECKFDVFPLDLHKPKRLAEGELYNVFCSRHPPNKDVFHNKILFCSKRSHNNIGKISAYVTYVLKQVLQVENHSVLIRWLV